MIISHTNLSAISENMSIKQSELIAKSDYTFQFILTGIQEDQARALTLDIDWGDGSEVEYHSKDVVYNYKENTIFDEILYGKLGGSILTVYNYDYSPTPNSFFTNLTAQLLITFSDGYYVNIYQPIKLVHESYYDNIKQLSVVNTQIHSLTSDTVANLQSKYNKQTYITLLERN
tara:strand:- start:4369 stop:4890 length:522 start_codon:yes stop_codon:yes gene_type:complete